MRTKWLREQELNLRSRVYEARERTNTLPAIYNGWHTPPVGLLQPYDVLYY